ncbi:MAG: hypothetical protein JWQ40_4415 [Segetibacter sp.]|nr:hypothetical protein [Segetibacter sp.]
MKKLSFIFIFFVAAINIDAQSLRTSTINEVPSNFFVSVSNSPFTNVKVDNSQGGNKTQWLVFSDRANNTTFLKPDGKTPFKALPLMDVFYVMDKQNGYLQIVKYNPAIVKRDKIKDVKSAEYLGWVEESKMLLWSKALVSTSDNHPEKALMIVNNKAVFESPTQYLKNDSIKVFAEPSLQSNGSCKLRLSDLAYVYKITGDGNFALLGRKEKLQFDTTCKSDILGWVSTRVVSPWGQRLFLTVAMPDSTSASDVEIKVNRAISGEAISEPVWRFSPPVNASHHTMNSFPVFTYATNANNSGEVTTAIPSSVFELKKTDVYNVKGAKLTYDSFIGLKKNIHSYNLVFLVDGGSSMKKYFPILVNFIQGIKNSLKTAYPEYYNFSYGAVIYRNKNNCSEADQIQSFGPTKNATAVSDFFYRQIAQTNACSYGNVLQPVYAGFNKALDLFPTDNFENNIIINVGTTGNKFDNTSPVERDLVRKIGKSNARILAFQPFSDYYSLFNNYVLQIRELLDKSAVLLAEQKKGWIVNSNDLVLTQKFNSVLYDSTAYRLDFPNNSMIPGGLVFSTKGSTGSFRLFENFISKTLQQIKDDNEMLLQSLDSAFNGAGIESANINAGMAGKLDNSSEGKPADWFKNLSYNGHHYFVRAISSDPAINATGVLNYSLILSQSELSELQDNVSRLAISRNDFPGKELRKELYSRFAGILSSRDHEKYTSKAIEGVTLSNALNEVTGIPVSNGLFTKYTLDDLKNSSKLSEADLGQVLGFLNKVNNNLKYSVTPDKKFISAGSNYYVLNKDVFN